MNIEYQVLISGNEYKISEEDKMFSDYVFWKCSKFGMDSRAIEICSLAVERSGELLAYNNTPLKSLDQKGQHDSNKNALLTARFESMPELEVFKLGLVNKGYAIEGETINGKIIKKSRLKQLGAA